MLHVYTWADYIKPELVKRVRARPGCRVVIDTFDSNEAMYAKLKAGATGYDLITPSQLHGQHHEQAGHAAAARPRAAAEPRSNVDPEYLEIALDPEMQHSVPYMLTNTGIAYLKSKVAELRADLGDVRPRRPRPAA